MPTRRDNRAERSARIEWLLEENRTKTEQIAAYVQSATRVIDQASKLAKANRDAAMKRRRASKA